MAHRGSSGRTRDVGAKKFRCEILIAVALTDDPPTRKKYFLHRMRTRRRVDALLSSFSFFFFFIFHHGVHNGNIACANRSSMIKRKFVDLARHGSRYLYEELNENVNTEGGYRFMRNAYAIWMKRVESRNHTRSILVPRARRIDKEEEIVRRSNATRISHICPGVRISGTSRRETDNFQWEKGRAWEQEEKGGPSIPLFLPRNRIGSANRGGYPLLDEPDTGSTV